MGRGGAQEAAPLGGGVSWSYHLKTALSVDKATARTGMDKDEKGVGPGPVRGRAAGADPGGEALETEGGPRGQWGGDQPWALTRGLGSGHRTWRAGLEADTGSLGPCVFTGVPTPGRVPT